jgi:hypothetical protein
MRKPEQQRSEGLDAKKPTSLTTDQSQTSFSGPHLVHFDLTYGVECAVISLSNSGS